MTLAAAGRAIERAAVKTLNVVGPDVPQALQTTAAVASLVAIVLIALTLCNKIPGMGSLNSTSAGFLMGSFGVLALLAIAARVKAYREAREFTGVSYASADAGEDAAVSRSAATTGGAGGPGTGGPGRAGD